LADGNNVNGGIKEDGCDDDCNELRLDKEPPKEIMGKRSSLAVSSDPRVRRNSGSSVQFQAGFPKDV
jgi:hypothetical protein